MKNYQNILCVIDLSSENHEIIEHAADMAKRYSAKLHLLHVVEHLPSEVTNNIVLPDNIGIEDQLVASAKASLDKIKSDMSLTDATTAVELGSTKNKIVEVANSTHADLIVIGRHGRHGISRLLGSTANAVLHHAPCDVLAIKVGK